MIGVGQSKLVWSGGIGPVQKWFIVRMTNSSMDNEAILNRDKAGCRISSWSDCAWLDEGILSAGLLVLKLRKHWVSLAFWVSGCGGSCG